MFRLPEGTRACVAIYFLIETAKPAGGQGGLNKAEKLSKKAYFATCGTPL